MNTDSKIVERVIGFDSHPDTFTAAFLRGPTPVAAVVEKTFNKVPMAQLQSWANKHTRAQDLLVLEASGNSFQVVRTLAAISRKALVLESCHLGKLKEAHANNDKISAVRIGKAYLAGTAKVVWVPDLQTQERRDWLHAHRKVQKRSTQVRNRLQSYLSDNGVRLKTGTRLAKDPEQAKEQIKNAREWSPRQWQVIEGLLMELAHAHQQRGHWRSLIAQEVLSDANLLSIVRLCGVREMVAFALGAIIGDIQRFGSPAKLVKYIGLNPAFDESGEEQWTGGIGGHGRKDLRCLLIESAQAILRCTQTPLSRWGRKLLARKGSKNLVVAAMARKLAVAVWYLMMGRWTAVEEIEPRLEIKIGQIIGRVAPAKELLKKVGKNRKLFREEIYQRLKTGRVYLLDPNKKFTPKTSGHSLAAEYGIFG
jgi:transposase